MGKKLTTALLVALVVGTVGLGMVPPQVLAAGGQGSQAGGGSVAATDTAAAAVTVTIDGKQVSYSDSMGRPYIDESNRTQAPLNQTMTSFGATVSWNAQTRTAIVTKGGTTVEVPVGQACIIVNGNKKQIDTAPIIRDGRTYLPVAHVLRAFGAEVGWDAKTKTVIVTTVASGSAGNSTGVASGNGGGSSAEGTMGQAMVHFIDVGQGDAILIDVGTFEILVDGGPRSAAETVVNYIKPYVDGELDVVIATHQHEDHIGGLPAVLEAYDVARVIDNGKKATSKIYQTYWNDVQAEGCAYENGGGKDITIAIDSQTKLQLIGMEGKYSDANNSSLIACLVSGDVEVLLTGDMEQKVEKANLNKFMDVDVLKAGHHGSDTSSGEPFLQVTKPETVIISCATGNTYRHPNLAAMQRFQKIGAKMFGTEKSGSIVMTTDGKGYQLSGVGSDGKSRQLGDSDQLTLDDAGDR